MLNRVWISIFSIVVVSFLVAGAIWLNFGDAQRGESATRTSHHDKQVQLGADSNATDDSVAGERMSGMGHSGGNSAVSNQKTESIEEREGDIAKALSGLSVPKKSVALTVQEFLAKPNPDKSDRMDLLTDLSFCANRRNVSQYIGEERGRDPEMAARMNPSLHAYYQHCTGVSDRDYILRRDLVQALAQEGDTEAKASFYSIGPVGRWPDENEHVAMSNEEIDTWLNTAIHYLNDAALAGNPLVFMHLAGIYASDPSDPIMGRVSDPVRAYAYDYVGAHLIQANASPEVRANLFRYMEGVEKNISREDRERGRQLAGEIFANLKK